jgi:hypothetical protein
MTWDITKKCWKLASDGFPDEKGIFVDIPPRMGASGTCPIYALNGKRIGEISYKSVVSGEKPFFALSLNDKKAYVNIPRFVGMEFPASRKIEASKIIERYGDGVEVQIAALVASAGVPLTETDVSKWMLSNGFATCDSSKVIAALGVVAGRRQFEDMEKVRVNNPSSMEHNEGGRVMHHKRMDGGFIYLVLVDGSSEPKWFAEKHLGKNTVGEVPYRTSLPRTNAE